MGRLTGKARRGARQQHIPVRMLLLMMVVVTTILFLSVTISAVAVTAASGDATNETAAVSSDTDLDGEGTPDSPYVLTTAAELQQMADDLKAHYVLENDIDASETEEWNDGDGFEPIGDDEARFNGSLDGQGHAISALTINRSDEEYVGLFGATAEDALIENVHLTEVTVYGDGQLGALVGHSEGDVIGSSMSGHVQAGEEDTIAGGVIYTGGLVGESHGLVTESYAVGSLYVPTSGTTNHYRIGGLVGSNSGEVTKSFADVEIDSLRGQSVGGLIGHSSGDVHNTHARGDVEGRDDVGGLVGDTGADALVTESFATGTVEGHFTQGGLIGHNDGDSFGAGAEVEDSYWNRESTELVDGLGNDWGTFTAEPMTTPDMVGSAAETTMDALDFSETWEIVDGSHPAADDDGYPILHSIDAEPQVQTPEIEHLMDGTGTEADPYQISTLTDLQNVAEYQHRHYKLTTDIDASDTENWNGGDGFEPIGEEDNSFTGTFDGQGHTISNLAIDSEDGTVGLFSVIHTEGAVENVTLTDAVIESESGDVGGLVGISHGNITTVSVSGEVIADSTAAGGLAGQSTGVVSNASADVTIDGDRVVGGLVGENGGTVRDSHAVGEVYGERQRVGGLVGSGGSIINSSATGDVEAPGSTGGLVGFAGAGITNSFATGNVTGSARIGGLVGSARGSAISFNFVASESYATGDVEGNSEVGGLIGQLSDTHVRDSYATGSVTAEEQAGGLVGENDDGSVRRSYATGSVQGDVNVGGAIGLSDSDSDIEYAYWDMNTTFRDEGADEGDGYWDEFVGLTTSEMSGSAAEENMAELDFTGPWESVEESHEFADENRYPILRPLDAELQIDAHAAADFDPSDASFDVTITDIEDDVYVGQTIQLSVDVENTGSAPAEQEIRLFVDDEHTDSTSLILNSDGNSTLDFEYETSEDELGDLPVSVESANDTHTETVPVIEFMSDTGPGDELWNFELDDRVESSPTIVDETVYFGDWDGYLRAVGSTTGEEKWNFSAESRFQSSPSVVNDTVYIGNFDGSVYAVDAESGEEEWSYETGDTVDSSPVATEEMVYVGSDDGHLYAIDADSGEKVWSFETDDDIEASPVVTGSLVYIQSTDGTLYALSLSDGEEEWTRSTELNMRSSPTAANGTLFYNDGGAITAVDAATGELRWEFATDTQPTSADRHTPTVAYGTVYQYDRTTGKVIAIDADDGTTEWSTDVFGYSGSRMVSPTVADETVFIGGGEITALDATDGTIEWTFEPEFNVESSPTVVDGALYVGSGASATAQGTVYAIDTGVDGSSEDSRVLHRTLGHHDEEAAIASFQPDPRVPVPGERFTLTAEESVTFNDEIEEYRWDVTDDGEIDEVTTDPFLAHEFSSEGTFQVGLEIVDDTGETASTSTDVLISERGSLAGEVVDEDGDAVSDATVTIRDGNVVIATAETDSEGTYDVDVQTGTFTVEITSEEYIPDITSGVEIRPNETTSLAAELVGPGTGTEDDPYRIVDVDGLQEIQDDLDAHYVLWNDIDAAETAEWNDGAGFEPIGYTDSSWGAADQPFTGSFDGQGHEITGLTIDRPDEDEVGLFGYAEEATITNVTLGDVDVDGYSWAVGSVVGFVENDAMIRNVEVSGAVSDQGNAWAIGGLAGAAYYDVVIEDVETDVAVSGDWGAGGLVGEFGDSLLENSSATGDVDGSGYLGGLLGFDWASEEGESNIVESHATGDVTGDDWGIGGLSGGHGSNTSASSATGDVSSDSNAVGGLMGEHYWGEVNRSYATGNVSGNSQVGGLTGYSDALVIYSSATGDVDGTENVGGIAGENWNEVVSSYTIGNVSGTEAVGGVVGLSGGEVTETYAAGHVSGDDNYGGIAGHNNDGSLTASYFDTIATAQTDAVGQNDGLIEPPVDGLSTDEMTGSVAEENMAFDFAETWETFEESDEFADIDSYPILQALDVESQILAQNVEPVDLAANFDWEPLEPETGETVTFDASDTTTPAGEIDEFRWDFTGDGTFEETTTGPETTYAFDSAGEYDVTLEVEDTEGQTADTTRTIVVAETVPVLEIEPFEEEFPDGTVGDDYGTVEIDVSETAAVETENLEVELTVVFFGTEEVIFEETHNDTEIQGETETFEFNVGSLVEAGSYQASVTVREDRSDGASESVSFELAPADAPTGTIDLEDPIFSDQDEFTVDYTFENTTDEMAEVWVGKNDSDDEPHISRVSKDGTITVDVSDIGGIDAGDEIAASIIEPMAFAASDDGEESSTESDSSSIDDDMPVISEPLDTDSVVVEPVLAAELDSFDVKPVTEPVVQGDPLELAIVNAIDDDGTAFTTGESDMTTFEVERPTGDTATFEMSFEDGDGLTDIEILDGDETDDLESGTYTALEVWVQGNESINSSYDIEIEEPAPPSAPTPPSPSPDPAEFELTIDEDQSTLNVTTEEDLIVVAEVSNTGDEDGTQSISLSAAETELEQTLSLDGGDTDRIEFVLPASMEYDGATALVETADDSASTTLTVREPDSAAFNVSIDEEASDVDAVVGESINLTATVTNEGANEETQLIESGLTNVTANENVTLEPNESAQVEFVHTVDESAVNESAFVQSEDSVDSIPLNVTVEEPMITVSIDSNESQLDVYEGEEVTVVSNLTNVGETPGVETVELVDDNDSVVDNASVDLDSDESTVEAFVWNTTTVEPGEYNLTVRTADDTANETARVVNATPVRSISESALAANETSTVSLSVAFAEPTTFTIVEEFDTFGDVSLVDDDNATHAGVNNANESVVATFTDRKAANISYNVTVDTDAITAIHDFDGFVNTSEDQRNATGESTIDVAAEEYQLTRSIADEVVEPGETTTVTLDMAFNTSQQFTIVESVDSNASIELVDDDGAAFSATSAAGDEMVATFENRQNASVVIETTVSGDASDGETVEHDGLVDIASGEATLDGDTAISVAAGSGNTDFPGSWQGGPVSTAGTVVASGANHVTAIHSMQ